MSRVARIVVPGVPLHVVHRGNRRGALFSSDDERRLYLQWLREYAERGGTRIWAYCLMANHVHLVAVAHRVDSLACTVGRTHWRYAQWLNARRRWTGHVWENRFYSCPLADERIGNALKYVECNPVRAGLVERAEDYAWSSARAHVMGTEDPLLAPERPFAEPITDWAAWLARGLPPTRCDEIRAGTTTGRPVGPESFVERLEREIGRDIRPRKRWAGPPATVL